MHFTHIQPLIETCSSLRLRAFVSSDLYSRMWELHVFKCFYMCIIRCRLCWACVTLYLSIKLTERRPGTVFILRFQMMKNRWSVSKIKGEEVWSMTKVIMMGNWDPGEPVHISSFLFHFAILFYICRYFTILKCLLICLRTDSHQINGSCRRRMTSH